MQLDSKEMISLVVGIIITALGVLQLFGITFNWFTLISPYLLAVIGLYLLVESIVELSNSNLIGWVSVIIGLLVMALGIFSIVQRFGIASFVVIPSYVHPIVFIVLGLFLVIAAFAMEP